MVHEYSGGRLPLVHIDLYRLDTPAQIIGAGLDAYFDRPPGLVVVEWCERWPEFSGAARAPSCFVHVQFEQTDEETRRITYDDSRP